MGISSGTSQDMRDAFKVYGFNMLGSFYYYFLS